MSANYRCIAQERLLIAMRALFDSPLNGVTLSHVANVAQTNKTQALRDLSNLAAARLAEKTPDGLWRPSNGFVSLAIQAQTALARAEARLADFRSAIEVARVL